MMQLKLLLLGLVSLTCGTELKFGRINNSPYMSLLPTLEYYDFLNDKNHHSNERANFIRAPIFERCLTSHGFMLDGICYQYINTAALNAAAVLDCQKKGGVLWIPNLDDSRLYEKLVDAMQGEPKASNLFGAISNTLHIGSISTNANLLNSHLVLSAPVPALGSTCGILKFNTGALTFSYVDCTAAANNFHYVCKLNL